MAAIITQQDLDSLLAESWDALCRFAYEHFLESGRGFVGVDRDDQGELQLLYATVPETSTFDDEIKAIVSRYNPQDEIVLHFACAFGKYRTVRVRNPVDRTPQAVWKESAPDLSMN